MRVWGIGAVALAMIVLAVMAVPVILLANAALWVADYRGIEGASDWMVTAHPFSMLWGVIFLSSTVSLLVLRCIFDLDGPFFAIMALSSSADTVRELQERPTRSFLSHLGSSVKKLGFSLGVAAVCYLTVLAPPTGIVILPGLVYFTAPEIQRPPWPPCL